MEKPSMLGYIYDQPRALRECFNRRNEFCEGLCELFLQKDIRKIYFLGSGTSYHASLATKDVFEKYLDVEVEVCIPTMFTDYVNVNNNNMYRNDQILVVGISQSGTSYSTVNAMKKAKEQGYCTVALTENLNSMICDEVDVVLHLLCGKEEIPVETRGYTVSVLTGFVWAIEVAKAIGKLTLEAYEKLCEEIVNLLNNFEEYLHEAEQWYSLNETELQALTCGHVAGYGHNYCTALEAVLKMYETGRKPLSAYELEELIHGPNMAFEDYTYIFIVASNEVTLKRIDLFTNWFKENNVTDHVFVFSDSRTNVSAKDLVFKNKIFDDLSPIVYTLPFQIMAARNALAFGYDTAVRRKNRTAFAHKYN